jgi:hypothetical protein
MGADSGSMATTGRGAARSQAGEAPVARPRLDDRLHGFPGRRHGWLVGSMVLPNTYASGPSDAYWLTIAARAIVGSEWAACRLALSCAVRRTRRIGYWRRRHKCHPHNARSTQVSRSMRRRRAADRGGGVSATASTAGASSAKRNEPPTPRSSVQIPGPQRRFVTKCYPAGRSWWAAGRPDRPRRALALGCRRGATRLMPNQP